MPDRQQLHMLQMAHRTKPPDTYLHPNRKRTAVHRLDRLLSYRRLDMTRKHIRLLHNIRPSDNFVVCELHQASLEISPLDGSPESQGQQLSVITRVFSTAPTYDALSNTWGPATTRQLILVNNRAFYVRQNIYNYLEMRAKDASGDSTSKPLWIDQICIDQSY
jgi:hypothetical protein